MNFLLRSTSPVHPDLPTVPEVEQRKDVQPTHKIASTLEGLIADESSSSEDGNTDGDVSGVTVGPTSQSQVSKGSHSDVTKEEGWIIIPCKELPDDWSEAPDMLQLLPLDRSFVFPGEQLHIVVCLSAYKQETEIITPFKVAAVMSKNGSAGKKQTEKVQFESSSTNGQVDINGTFEETAGQVTIENGETISNPDVASEREDISATESLLRMEGHKHQTEALMERFRNSNFFVRIAQADEPLWSKRNVSDLSADDSEVAGRNLNSNDGGLRNSMRSSFHSEVIDRGSFDGNTSGGVARNTAKCYSLRNDDIVVLLLVNVAVNNIKDPVLEVLQFENCGGSNVASENRSGLLTSSDEDPCRELLNWLLPLDRTLPPHSLSPPLSSSSALGSVPRSISTTYSSSQIFSFGHFRSNSMPLLPQVSGPPSTAIPSSNSKPAFDLEDFSRFPQEKMSHDMRNDGLLSFRGVPLEPQRFSVHCGLEGIYLPGRRWRKKLEIIQPVAIHSFASECMTEDILCVQVKNICPAHLPDVIIYLDAIAIVFEEASKGGPPLSLPIASIETGNGFCLPNLALRRGEEHSFILKPSSITGGDLKGPIDVSSLQSHPKMGSSGSYLNLPSSAGDGRNVSPTADQYAVLVSCRCNYSESKLFFKQPTGWRPRIARDLLISVVSEISEQSSASNGRVPQLPVQVLTLQASNLTSEDLTLTVLAPISSNSSPSVVPLNPLTNSRTPFSLPERMGRAGGVPRLSSMPIGKENHKESISSGKRSISLGRRTGASHATADVTSSDLGCTHLWLQSTVPLGCVPACSSATVKLELLPLTDGIITLDTLQVAVKEKGMTYIPEQALKIHATSSIASGIV